MKKIIFVLICLSLYSCSKEDSKNNQLSIEQKLIGKWTWNSTCGGFTGLCTYPKTNFYLSIEFQNNKNFIQKLNDTIFDTGNYSIIKKISPTDTIYFLIFSNNKIIKSLNNVIYYYYLSLTKDSFQTQFRIYNNDLTIGYGDIADSYEK